MDLAAEKRALRIRLRALPRPSGRAAEACGIAAAGRLAASAALDHARRVALFASAPDEIDTRPIFELLRGLGRVTLFPRIRRGDGLDFVALWRWEELRMGAFGVREPSPGAAGMTLAGADLVLVPGLGFDRRGRRLGRGGGHYDRTFPPGAAAPVLFGLGFACQLLDEVPVGAHDRWMDGVLTEHGLLRTAVGRGTE